jgi:ATP-binding cassette subfamily B protein
MTTAEANTAETRYTPRQVASALGAILRLALKVSPAALPAMIVLLALTSLLPFGTSFLESRVIDEIVRLLGLPPDNRLLDTLIPLIVVVIAANVLERFFWILIGYAEQITHYNLTRALTLRFLQKASELDMAHHESQASSNLIQKAKDSYSWKPAGVISRTVYMSGDLIRILTSMAIILSFSFPAFLLALLTTIPTLIARLKLGEGSWGIWAANATDRRRFWYSADLLTRENALMELRIFRTRLYLLDTIREIYDRFTNKERKDALRRTLIESVVGNLSTIGTMAFWVIAILATLNGQITLGLLTFYTGALDQFSNALTNLFRNLSDYYEDGLYLADLNAYHNLPTMVKPGARAVSNQPGQPPRIEFREVSFTYPNAAQPVLKHFNLVIEPGAHIALVGVNGAGKSTIIKLPCRFYDVTEGQILINGVDMRDLDFESWYRQIGVLFQDFIQYGQFSARTNIELGDIDGIGNPQRVEQAIFKADAEVFLKQYADGLETVLDKSFEGGTNPSVGQWQRIALARAFFRDAPVLVLDEPTSAIDALAEYEIFERLYSFSANKTLVIISHRFSTVRNADLIYVIDDGQIIESGSHEALLRRQGQYAKAFEAQAQGYR